MPEGCHATQDARAALGSALAAVHRDCPMVSAYLYGSRARGDARPRSDYDVSIFLDETARGLPPSAQRLELDLIARLEELSGIRESDARIMNHAPLMARGKVLTEGVLLFVGDDDKRVRLERETRIMYFDYQWTMDRLNRAILSRVAAQGL